MLLSYKPTPTKIICMLSACDEEASVNSKTKQTHVIELFNNTKGGVHAHQENNQLKNDCCLGQSPTSCGNDLQPEEASNNRKIKVSRVFFYKKCARQTHFVQNVTQNALYFISF